MRVITPTQRKLVMTRVFDAPRSLVFDALTKPEMLERWLEPRGSSLVVCEIDLRVGGAFRFVWRGPERVVAMRGVYREIVPPERFVHTQSFDDEYRDESLVTTVLVEEGGKTTLTTTVLYPTDQLEEARWVS